MIGKVMWGSPTILKYVIERDGNRCSTPGCPCVDGLWLGQPISYDVDHIDGDPKNNDPINWRLLCPNCHRQTPTWGMKKREL